MVSCGIGEVKVQSNFRETNFEKNSMQIFSVWRVCFDRILKENSLPFYEKYRKYENTLFYSCL